MGAFVSVTAEQGETAEALLSLVPALENEISHKVSSSSIAALNRGESVTLSDDLLSAISLSLEIQEKTNGAFSIFLLPLTSLWDFEEGRVPSPSDLLAALREMERATFTVDGKVAYLSGGGIDLGAVGKGMAADTLANALRKKEQNGIVAVGGSIGAVGDKGGKSWLVGIRDPFSDAQGDTLGTLSLSDAFVSTSGSYEKTFSADGVQYHHILDSKTGMPVESELISVTVIADSGILSDMLSTALFAVGIDAGVALCAEYGADALFVQKDGTLLATRGFAARFSADGKEVRILET